MNQLIRTTLALVLYFVAIWFAYEIYGWTFPVIILLFLFANNLERSTILSRAFKEIQQNFIELKRKLENKVEEK